MNDMVAGRVPPNDLDAEGSVLSALMLDAEARDVCLELLTPASFYADANARIFEAAKYLADNAQPVDVVSVAARLRDVGRLDQVGGTPYLAGLAREIPAVVHVERHAEIIRDKARQRAVVALCQRFAAEGYGAIGNVPEWLQRVEKAFFEAIEETKRGEDAEALAALVPRAVDVLEARARGGGEVPGVDVGLPDVTKLLGGLALGEMTVLAARPKMGKTAFALNLARNVAGTNKIAIYASAEMPKEQLANRLIASEARVDVTRVMSGNLNREEWSRIVAGVEDLKALPLAISYRPGMRLGQLRADVRRVVREMRNTQGSEAELGLIVADYMQLMDGERQRGDSRETEVSGLSRGLKWIAGEFGCPVLALSQLNREVEKRPNKRPLMSDLRESGAIEQDAYAILFLYRDEVYNKNSEDVGVAEVIVAANRNGPPGTARVKFTPEYTRFDTLATEWDGVGDDVGGDYGDDPRYP